MPNVKQVQRSAQVQAPAGQPPTQDEVELLRAAIVHLHQLRLQAAARLLGDGQESSSLMAAPCLASSCA